MFGLYLHIPYCRSKCNYCDFYSIARSEQVPDAYVDALCLAMKTRLTQAPDTLYFGGGTPSLLSPAQLSRCIDTASPRKDAEITLEANPETITLALLQDYRKAGINRLSLGIQSAYDDSLARLGRRHTAAQGKRALALALQAGFTNISCDVMLALPQYSLQELTDTIHFVSEGATHVSSYLLKIEPNTVFGKRPPILPDEDASADFYLAAVEQLAAQGYAQYEISNFAKPGFSGKHNLIYWNCEDYLGLGAGAHSCMQGKRFAFTGNAAQFMERPTNFEMQGDCTSDDFIMLQLRLNKGLSLYDLNTRYGIDFTPAQRKFIHTLCQNKLALFDGDTLALTARGMLVQNSILCELL